MNAKQLRNAILQQAIEGRLVPQDPTDEPASVLLKRIHAEKQRLMKEGKLKKQKPLPPVTDKEKPFEIPKSWEWVRLGGIIKDVTYGTSNKSEKHGKIPVLRMGNIQNGYIDYKDLVYSSNENDITKYALRSGDLLFNRTNSQELVGKTGIYKGEKESIFAGYLIRFRTIFISSEFINYIMQSRFYKIFCLSVQTKGVSQANINAETLKSFSFPLPPLAEQQRIVAKLEEILPEVDDYGNKQDELVKQENIFPDLLRKSLLQEAIEGRLVPQNADDEPASILLKRIHAEKTRLVKEGKLKKQKPLPPVTNEEKPFEIPESWEWVRLGEISSNIHYGFTASASTKGNAKLLRITDIQNNTVNWDNVPFCNIKEKDFLSYKLMNRDILIARTGGTIGKTYLVQNLHEDSVFASYLIRVSLFSTIFEKFIYSFMNSPLYWQQLKKASMGTGQPNVNGTALSNLCFPLPPLSEQQRIVAKLEELRPLCSELDNHNK